MCSVWSRLTRTGAILALALLMGVAVHPGSQPLAGHDTGISGPVPSSAWVLPVAAASPPLVAVASLVQQSAPPDGVPLNVSLAANVSGGSPPYQETWNFGDGAATAGGAMVTHLYAQAGSYLVLLVVEDSSGTRASSTIDVGTQDYAAPGSPDVTVSSQLVSADPNATVVTFGAGPPISTVYTVSHYHWDFGDGTSAAIADPVHAYHEAGDYLVAVTVEFNFTFASQPNQTWWNATYWLNELVVAPSSEPLISLATAGSSYSGDYCMGTLTTVQFLSAEVQGGNGDLTYDWAVQGLGAEPPTRSVNLGSLAPGRYNVSLTVSDASGAAATSSTVMQVYPVASPAQPCLQPFLDRPLVQVLLVVGLGAIGIGVGLLLIVRQRRRRAQARFDEAFGRKGT